MIRTIAIASTFLALSQTAALAGDVAVAIDRGRLAEPAYVAALYDQLESAAETVCRQELRGALLKETRIRTCVKYTLAESVAKIDAALLTAYAEGDIELTTVASSR